MRTPTRRYAVYGVSVTSDIDLDLPGWADAAGLGEVVLLERASTLRVASARDAGTIEEWFVCELLEDGSYYLRWKDYYEFRIEPSGVRVDYHGLGGADPNILRYFLFGQVLSFSLVLQGIEPLHATAVRVDNRAVAFLGDCTFGKSTLAASFLQDGYPILTDDLLLIDRRGGRSMALPGSGRIKLQPDVLHLLDASGPGTPLNPLTEKQAFSLARDQREVDPLPLAALFVLPTPVERSAGRAIAARPLSRPTLFHELLKNSFNADVVEAPRLARHFAFAADLARDVPGFALCYPAGLEHLPAVRRAVLAAAESIRRPRASLEPIPVEAGVIS